MRQGAREDTVVEPPVLVAGLLHSVDGLPIGARA